MDDIARELVKTRVMDKNGEALQRNAAARAKIAEGVHHLAFIEGLSTEAILVELQQILKIMNDVL